MFPVLEHFPSTQAIWFAVALSPAPLIHSACGSLQVPRSAAYQPLLHGLIKTLPFTACNKKHSTHSFWRTPVHLLGHSSRPGVSEEHLMGLSVSVFMSRFSQQWDQGITGGNQCYVTMLSDYSHSCTSMEYRKKLEQQQHESTV
jgi:hypothetical protein